MNNIKDYFLFSKKERISIIILLILIVVILILPFLFSYQTTHISINNVLQQNIIALQQNSDSLQQNNTSQFNQPINPTTNSRLFYFNPNTINLDTWKKLGISEKTATTILKYVNKGGKFRKPEDLRKIWGLKKIDADRLVPYVQIMNVNNTLQPNKDNSFKEVAQKNTLSIDINTATVFDFKKLTALGYSLPYKIINFRDKLGGFISIQQVKETYDLTDSIFNVILPFLQLQTTTIKQLNINTAEEYELNKHPYIDKRLSKAIVTYRMQHGLYKSVQEIKNIAFVTQPVFDKILPYVTVN